MRCVDWSTRDLVRRIRSVRRRLRELEPMLAKAEEVAARMERGAHRWPNQAALTYFRVLARVEKAIFEAARF